MTAHRLRNVTVAIGACLAAACATANGQTAAPAARPPGTSAANTTPPASPSGQRLYGMHCLSCHQADGGGVPDMQPAIAGGTWVQGDARALALFVMSGGFDSASRKDSAVDNVMPAFRHLADGDLALILTYIREKFGNGASPVTAADVAAARQSGVSP